MAKKNENLYTTPRGTVAGFTSLQKATANYNGDGEEFKTTVAFEGDAAASLIADLTALRDAFIEETYKSTPKEKLAALKKQAKLADIGRPELDEEGEETGRVLITFKQAASITFTSKKTGKEETFEKQIALFDSRGNPIKVPVRIGGGSVVKVSFEPNPYFSAKDKEFGVSFNRLSAVKLIKLVEFSGAGGSADDYGFGGDEEDADDDGAFDASAYTAPDKGEEQGGEADF